MNSGIVGGSIEVVGLRVSWELSLGVAIPVVSGQGVSMLC
jgi:hypothetical protein